MILEVSDSTINKRLWEQFRVLLEESCNIHLIGMDSLPGDASGRKYFRMHHNSGTLIGVWGNDKGENHSFIYFCEHFYSIGLSVPKVYANNADQGIYLVEDLGYETLADKTSDPSVSQEEVLCLYVQSAKDLAGFQVLGHVGLDYENNCHQSPVFDRKNVKEDLQYFIENFFIVANDYLKISGIEDELEKLTGILTEPQPMLFLYRDFQCRNMLVRPNGSLGYVDFQAGRRGPLQYDVATLLYASKANISDEARDVILTEYLDQLEMVLSSQGDLNSLIPIDRRDFISRYYVFVLFRILRALGVYLFLAVYEGHWRFLGGVPGALNNLAGVFSKHRDLIEAFPKLNRFVKRLSSEEVFMSPDKLMRLVDSRQSPKLN